MAYSTTFDPHRQLLQPAGAFEAVDPAEWITHLSAPCMTSQVKRPWPRAVITSRPRA